MVSKLLTISALVATILALPDVTPKQLPSGCASYPNYDADTGETGSFVVKVVDSENPAIEGFSDTSDYSIGIGAQGRPYMRWGYLTIPVRNDIAKTSLKCSDAVLHAYVNTELTAAGAPTNTQWAPLVLSPYANDGVLLYKVEGEEVGVYEHYVGEEKQPGLFLGGYDNSTTWGFTYIAPDATSTDGNYQMRLIRGTEEVGTNETRGFVKILGS
ncbi:uncharacterized protein N0V89_006067 [Didymosphaeria variabile]|uniref:Uncharacterized protein n=1 Tax=Didymosphaeria variabile TaxID=1932322 RepID=A0A9W8XPP6_9PLEO|nr:uncharacterized protein N0V89_006067 [Didymosphaeria variabile]KAJ4354332.1 hypothetical protein N0V89_006067 [Didymosphaeria variabile]